MADTWVELKIAISKSCYKKVKEQVEFFKQADLKDFKNINTPESLISKYLEQMTSCEEQYKMIQHKMQDVINVLNEKGVDMLELFNSLNTQFEDEKIKKRNIREMKKS